MSATAEVEERVQRIWERVLGRFVPSRDVSFFALGGSSLQAVEVICQVNAEFGCELDILALLECPSVGALSLVAQGASGGSAEEEGG